MKKLILIGLVLNSLISFSACKVDGNCVNETNKVEIKKSSSEQIPFLNDNVIKNSDVLIYTEPWCPHCREEYKSLQYLYNKYKPYYNIALVVGNLGVSPKEAKEFFDMYKYNFPVYFDKDDSFQKSRNIQAIPAIFIDKNKEKQSDLTSFDENDFRKLMADKINMDMKVKLAKYMVADANNYMFNLLSVIPKNAIIIYGSTWCPDCKKEIPRLLKIRGDRQIIYIVRSKNYSFNEFKNYVKNHKIDGLTYYYSKDDEAFKKDFDISWVPSVCIVENNIVKTPFVANNIYLQK